MKCVLISIKPKWCELIANGTKTVEVRKTKPKLNTPFKCYIYCTKPSKKYQTVAKPMVLNDDELFKLPNGQIKYGDSIELLQGYRYGGYSEDNFLNGKVIGEFICDDIFMMWDGYVGNQGDDCLTFDGREEYLQGNNGYGWHISNLLIYDKPKELGDFARLRETKFGYEPLKVERPPKSFYYVEGTIYCKNCKYLMFSDFYGECRKGYKGILNFDDFCDKGELR